VARYKSIEECNGREKNLELAGAYHQKKRTRRQARMLNLVPPSPYTIAAGRILTSSGNSIAVTLTAQKTAILDIVSMPKFASQCDDETLQTLIGCKSSLLTVFL
jgi:hypothetical protein